MTGDEEGTRFEHRDLNKKQVLAAEIEKIIACSDISDKMLVFVNKKDDVPDVVAELRAAGICCEGFTADLSFENRQDILQKFRHWENKIPILVCTQLLGRGHDFPNLKNVVSFDKPTRMSEYVHRVGRTARGGEEGRSLMLLEPMDLVSAREVRDCLKATDQETPQWLLRACSDRNHQKYVQMCRNARNQFWTSGRTPTAEPQWQGRGRGAGLSIRLRFLDECEGHGAARMHKSAKE